MKLSLNIGSREFSIGATKSTSALAAAFARGDDLVAGGAMLSSSYQQSTWVYACVSAIAEQIAQIPFRFSRAEEMGSSRTRRKAVGETIVESGPVVALFNNPHPHLNRFQFWELLVSWLQLRGEFFAVPMDRNFTLGLSRPSMLAVLSPDQFRPDVRANMLIGWRYQGQGHLSPAPTMNLLTDDVITDRLANPFDFWRGMSPLTVARLAAESDFASAQFMKGLMLNNADTGVVITTDQQADEPQREAILSALRDRKRKAGTADRPLFLWGGAKLEKPTLSSADMQFLEQRKFNRQEICAVFKVPQEIIGFTEDANRSVSDSARLNFIENRIAPLCERIEAALDPFIKSQDADLYGWFDIEALPIMQAARRERYAVAMQAFNMGVPIDDCSDIFDLGLPDDLPHAGKSFLPFSLQEVGGVMPEFTNPEPAPDDTAQDDPIENAAKFFAAIKSEPAIVPHVCAPNPEYEASIAGSVKSKAGALKKFFFEQRNRVLAALEREAGKEMTSATAVARGIDDIFNEDDENRKLIEKLKSRLIADLKFGGAQLFKEIGAGDFNLPPTQTIKFLELRSNPIKKINETTWERVRAELVAGVAAGESYSQLADRVKSKYNTSEERADSIAFTETNIAVNSGRNEAMIQARVERKGWQTSHLENTRASHIANEKLSNDQGGIPIKDAWPNGLMFPGDPTGEPGETINCRCFGYAVIGKGISKYASPLLKFEEFKLTLDKDPLQNAVEPLQNGRTAKTEESPDKKTDAPKTILAHST